MFRPLHARRSSCGLGQNDPAQAKQIALRLRHGVLEFRPTAPLASRAIELALELNHLAYDCFYLALAEAEEAELVTADLHLENCVWQHAVGRLG